MFSLGGLVHVADLTGTADPAVRVLTTAAGAFDPQPDPTRRRVAYVGDRAVRIVGLVGGADGDDRRLVGSEEPHLSWGMAEFVAAEEMGRGRGFWWAPDGERLAVARVDVSPVQQWHIGDPGHPERLPQAIRYPAAGTPNADVSLHLVALDGTVTPVDWDREALPYLVDVHWSEGGLLLVVQPRHQRALVALTADPATGATTVLDRQADDRWVEIVPGVPRFGPGGALVTTRDVEGVRRLVVGGAIVSGGPPPRPDLHVRAVVSVDDDGVVFTASDPEVPEEVHVRRWTAAGGVVPLTEEPGVHSAAAGGPTVVIRSATMAGRGRPPRRAPRRRRRRRGGVEGGAAVAHAGGHLRPGGGASPVDGAAPAGRRDRRGRPVAGVAARAARPLRRAPRPTGATGPGRLPVVAVVGRPGVRRGRDRRPGHARAGDRVGAGRPPRPGRARSGRPGGRAACPRRRAPGPRPRRASASAVGRSAATWPRWPCCAGPTCSTPRSPGRPSPSGASTTRTTRSATSAIPTVDPGPYDRSSLLADAPRLTRPLQLIHGLADDNVVAAHTVQLSQALLEAGRPHAVLPLSGVTHMTPQEVVAENLLLLQVAFLQEALGLPATAGS